MTSGIINGRKGSMSLASCSSPYSSLELIYFLTSVYVYCIIRLRNFGSRYGESPNLLLASPTCNMYHSFASCGELGLFFRFNHCNSANLVPDETLSTSAPSFGAFASSTDAGTTTSFCSPSEITFMVRVSLEEFVSTQSSARDKTSFYSQKRSYVVYLLLERYPMDHTGIVIKVTRLRDLASSQHLDGVGTRNLGSFL